ncbi:unnamed protein product [Sphenostylis stenocarpa]|uniref:C2H2-type domain-containing protein n=1 Tax=Sphenostylis stenocarpa TaxID=92480 RepID=A0AA86W142_9FABA|nr:unnamed protein product [Sphenostylis stenocarpa]
MDTQTILNVSRGQSESNSGEDPNQNNQNGFRCLICNLVFLSFQALIAHALSHFPLDDPAIREIIPNLMESDFGRLMMTQETCVFYNNMVFQAPSDQPMVMQETQIHVMNRVLEAQAEEPMVMSEPRANSFPCVTQETVAASQSLQGPPHSMLSVSADVIEVAQLLFSLIHQTEMEVSPIDGTRPYINLLDKPINDQGFNQVIINDDDALDLALKL